MPAEEEEKAAPEQENNKPNNSSNEDTNPDNAENTENTKNTATPAEEGETPPENQSQAETIPTEEAAPTVELDQIINTIPSLPQNQVATILEAALTEIKISKEKE